MNNKSGLVAIGIAGLFAIEAAAFAAGPRLAAQDENPKGQMTTPDGAPQNGSDQQPGENPQAEPQPPHPLPDGDGGDGDENGDTNRMEQQNQNSPEQTAPNPSNSYPDGGSEGSK